MMNIHRSVPNEYSDGQTKISELLPKIAFLGCCFLASLTCMGVVCLQLLDIEDGFLSLMDDTGNTRDDLKVPEGDIGEEIQREYGDGKDLLVR